MATSTLRLASESSWMLCWNASSPSFRALIGAPFIEPDVSRRRTQAHLGSAFRNSTLSGCAMNCDPWRSIALTFKDSVNSTVVSINTARFHHKFHVLEARDICEGISFYGYDVGERSIR